MELKPRQLQTIEDLKRVGKTTPQQIISWCYIKMTQPHQKRPRKPNRRKFGIHYYQEIADYFEVPVPNRPIPEQTAIK